MRAPVTVACVAVVAALAGGLMAFRQRAVLQELRINTGAVKRPALVQKVSTPPATPQPRAATDTVLSQADRRELLRLRGEVSRLRRRERELAPLKAENDSLRARAVAGSATADGAASGDSPAGYVRRRDAQFMGAATPEAALQSFFWAIEHHDTNALMGLLGEDQKQELMNLLVEKGQEEFWTTVGMIPGYRLIGTEPKSEDEVRLRLEFLPDDSPQEWTVKRSGGEWKLSP